jgi:hypothetical protein
MERNRMLTEDQNHKIIECAKRYNVVDARNTKICPGILITAFKQIENIQRKRKEYRIYLNPILLTDWIKRIATESCDFGFEPAYLGVVFKTNNYIPPDVVLITRPNNLIVYPFIEEEESWVRFENPDDLCLIINISS